MFHLFKLNFKFTVHFLAKIGLIANFATRKQGMHLGNSVLWYKERRFRYYFPTLKAPAHCSSDLCILKISQTQSIKFAPIKLNRKCTSRRGSIPLRRTISRKASILPMGDCASKEIIRKGGWCNGMDIGLDQPIATASIWLTVIGVCKKSPSYFQTLCWVPLYHLWYLARWWVTSVVYGT